MYSFLCTNPNSFIDTKENNSLLYLSTFVCFPLLLSNPESNTDFDDHSSCAASRHLLHQPSMIHTLLPLPLATVNSSRLRILNRPFSMMTTPPTSPKKMHHRRHLTIQMSMGPRLHSNHQQTLCLVHQHSHKQFAQGLLEL